MRSIPTLAFVMGLAACQLGANETAAAASDPLQPSQTDCRAAAPNTADRTTDQPASPACEADVAPHLVQRRPGFWIAEDVGSASGGNVADPPVVLQAGDTPAPAGSTACASYPLPIVVGGQSLQARIVTCPQPDGSWRATQYTPGLPPQVYTVAAPPAAGASPNDYASPGDYQDWGPGWSGGPWFWGFAPAIVVVQRSHFFHGFNHGFVHGFSHGFAHGSAVGHGGFGGMHR